MSTGRHWEDDYYARMQHQSREIGASYGMGRRDPVRAAPEMPSPPTRVVDVPCEEITSDYLRRRGVDTKKFWAEADAARRAAEKAR